MTTIRKRVIILLFGIFIYTASSIIPHLSSIVYAAVPHLINYQGRLTDSGGTPLNGSYSLTFRIYDAESAGNLLWQEIHPGVTIQKGIFSILFGSVTNLDLPFDKPYFLEIVVSGEVMSPRQRITSAGYAIRAEKAEDANTVGNFSVSTTPAPNSLLVLDSDGRLPAGSGLLRNNIVILTGVISNGGTIPLPMGYTQDQCFWLAGLGRIAWGDDQHATEFDIGASADANRVVSVIDYRHGWQRSWSYANYIIIGIK